MPVKKSQDVESMAGRRRTIDGTCVVVEDVMKGVKTYTKMLGWGPWDIYRCRPPQLSETTLRGKNVEYTMDLAITKIGPAYFELITPIDGPSTYREFLDRGGKGVQHVQSNYNTWGPVRRILDDYKKAGIGIVQSGKFCGNHFYYLDTEKTLGTIYEILKVGPLDPPESRYP